MYQNAQLEQICPCISLNVYHNLRMFHIIVEDPRDVGFSVSSRSFEPPEMNKVEDVM
jgi:hypothetical protein